MKIKRVNPALIELIDPTDADLALLRQRLSYKSKKKMVEYVKFCNNKYLIDKMGREAYVERKEELKLAQTVNLVLEKKDKFYTYIGLLPRIMSLIPIELEKDNIVYPPNGHLPYKVLPQQPRYYQRECYDLLIQNRHGACSLPTGSGKSLIIKMLAKFHGLKTVIMVPSDSIGGQIYSDLVEAFGKKFVGMFGGGKKEFKKRITVAIDKSLIRVEPDSEEFKELSTAAVVIVDESHMVATEVQEEVMLGLLRKTPYRYFFSATQFRNDGSDLLLEGITGPVVYEAGFRKLVNEEFLANPKFVIVEDYETYPSGGSGDPLKELEKSFYKNKKMHIRAANLANKCVAQGMGVLIMIDRIEQFSLLEKNLNHNFMFAYGSLTKDQKKYVPIKYHGFKSAAIVKAFNNREVKLVIGTRAIGMGTDTRPVDVIINLQGGQSDAKFMQLIGRGTRRVPGKTDFFFFDFSHPNHPLLSKWASTRHSLFRELSDDISVL